MQFYPIYSAKQYYETGNGLVSVGIDVKGMSEEDIKLEVERLRNLQKEANIDFKLKLKHMTSLQDKINNIKVNTNVDLILDSRTGNSCVFFGGSKQGKTTLMMYLHKKYYNSNDYICTLFCKNPQISKYKKIPRLIIYPGFDQDAKDLIKSHHYINTHTNNNYDFVEMFDDIIDTRYSQIVNELCCTYRNSNMSSMFCLQHIKTLSLMNRCNVNNCFLFRFNTDEVCKMAIQTYLSDKFEKMGIHGMTDQLRFYNKVTKNHGFIYWNYRTDEISFHKLNLSK